MPNLYRADVQLGNMTCIDREPQVLELYDHIYCPYGTPDCVPGIYDFGRKIVHQSTYSRGPVPSEVVPTCSMPFDYSSVKECAEDETYAYLGPIHDHFGHFLLSTLSRLWQIQTVAKKHKILIHAGATTRLQRSPFRQLFEAFGVDMSRFWSPEQPVRLRKLLLPCPSFEERNFVHAVFGKSFNDAGDWLAQGASLEVPGTGPIYLSKSKLTAGVRKIMNESIVEEQLAANGYSILYPETLSMNEQVALWRLGRPVVAFSGSSLHTSAFSAGTRMVSLGWDRTVDSSFGLCDWAKQNKSDYFYFEPGSIYELGPSPDHVHGVTGLSSQMQIADPAAVAEGILRAVDAAMSRRGNSLSQGKATSQSSTYIEGDYDASKLGATSGKLTGRYQFCTCCEENPWWQVDLGDECIIEEVIVYNRTDSAPERSSEIIIAVSADGVTYQTIYHRQHLKPFGGLNGEPLQLFFTSSPTIKGRFIRLSISGTDFFHLDQVDIFGRECGQ